MAQPLEHPDMGRDLAPAAQLRSIAMQLQAMIEGGDFGLCFTYVRNAMAELPSKLLAISDEL